MTKYHPGLLLLSPVIFIMSCHDTGSSHTNTVVSDSTRREKFEPANGKVILFTGQDLESIGGTGIYHDGYFDHFPAPGGFTQYTDFHPDPSKPISPTNDGLKGLTVLADWGDGPESMAITTADPDFKNSCLAIGLDMSLGNDSVTAAGGHDALIYKLGGWIKDQGNRPVFLRIGYEFNGYEWNNYKKQHYIPAWKRIRDKFDSMQVSNVAYVWQSKGIGTTREELDAFYPGDEYVDWVAYSYFIPADSVHPMIQFARDHRKPLFIAESSTVFLDEHGICQPLDLTQQADAERAWRDWFLPYFRTIDKNPDVIKAIHYINSFWRSRPMWKENPYFKNIDARITKNDSLKAWWSSIITKEKYLQASDTLFRYLWESVGF